VPAPEEVRSTNGFGRRVGELFNVSSAGFCEHATSDKRDTISSMVLMFFFIFLPRNEKEVIETKLINVSRDSV